MPEFKVLTSRMAPLPIDNIDTDQIIPASYLKVIDKSGLGEGLFSRWRVLDDGSLDENFVLNQPQYSGAEILLAGENFGCGSSREHAPWALIDYGFRVVISSRFADIFTGNSFKNGLLLIAVAPSVLGELFESVERDPGCVARIDLEGQTLTAPSGDEIAFEVDPFAKQCLLRGTDQLGLLLEQLPAIETFEAERSARIATSSGHAE
jgi:3-isopropylmalate/(R)-2-methylmalate dehydratase small subunit